MTEQKPAAWVRNLTDPQPHCVTDLKYMSAADVDAGVQYVPVYAAREWQGLTDEEIREFEMWLDDEEEKHGWNPPTDIVKYLEAKLKEKNNF